MSIFVVAHGKLKERGFRELCDDYLGRLRRYARVQEIEVRGVDGFERAIPKDALLVALEVNGSSLTSSELAKKLENWTSRGKGDVAFAIGGAEGLPHELSERAAFRLSLSAMTLPHRLARLILLEQIYRAFTILRGEPYARED